MEKKLKIIFLVSFFQIFLIVNSVVAFSYMVSKTLDFDEQEINDFDELNLNEYEKDIEFLTDEYVEPEQSSAFLRWLKRMQHTYDPFLEIEGAYEMIERSVNVDPEMVSLFCCPKTKQGAICQDLYGAEKDKCSVETYDVSCKYISDCKIGCCYDSEEGFCYSMAPKGICEDFGGEWTEEKNCINSKCEKKCCILGGDVAFVTESRCEYLSLIYGFKKDFRDIKTEYECLALKENQNEGACIFLAENCRFLTESECSRMNGIFYKNYLCSNPDLETECEKQKFTGCAEGKDEIYWFDSCGNRENIYSSNKDFSWNNGFVLSKNKSCNPFENNANSATCGNCNIILGSICSDSISRKINHGNFICKNLNCPASEKTGGKQRYNGESWCFYDSYVGDGKDTVGSRHWKYYCLDGDVKVEPCPDYRAGICVENKLTDDSGDSFSMAQCIANEAFVCMGLSPDECKKYSQCVLKKIHIGESFKFDACVGHYPRGFDLSLDNNRISQQEGICSSADATCVVVYQKDWKGRWKCVHNCNCATGIFSQKMNDFCISLGDCGSYINYLGQGTDNIKVFNAPSISWRNYVNYKNIRQGYSINPPSLKETLEKYYGYDLSEYQESTAAADTMKFLGTISGATASIGMAGSWALTKLGYGGIISSTTVTSTIGTTTSITTSTVSASGLTGALSAVGYAAAAALIGMYIGKMIAGFLGVEGQGVTGFMIAGALAGAGYAIMTMKAFSSISFLGPYMLIAAVIIAVWTLVIGWGKTKEVKVEFKCQPWQPPTRVSNEICGKCHEDDLKPCSEYKCNSLGRNCMIINENSQYPRCIAIQPHNNPLNIFPDSIQENYAFKNPQKNRVEIRTKDSECIPEFTPVIFSLNTTEYARCYYEYTNENNIDDMTGRFAEGNYYTIKHTNLFYMPSLASLEAHELQGDIRELFGNINMYVKCEDIHENKNSQNYVINFCVSQAEDITPAKIIDSNPKNNSYIKFNQEETRFIIYLNEPAECRYSYENKIYNEMENQMNCLTDVFNLRVDGWPCYTNLTELNKDENLVYIKCKDQPWISQEQDEKRNININPFVYLFKKTKEKLEITSVKPTGNIKQGKVPFEIEIQVQTSGGAENGNSICYYRTNKDSLEIEFFETGGKIHTQKRNIFLEGDYTNYVFCVDSAGNSAEAEINFNIEIDTKAPEIVRIYNSGNEIIAITNEQARCYYNTEKCNFNLEDGEKMTTAYSYKHSAQWTTGKTYYIKCEDIWSNTNIDCAIQAVAQTN